MKPNETTPTLRDLVARAGYYRHLDIDRLHAEIVKYPGCATLKPRNLQSVLLGRVKVSMKIGLALSEVLGQPVEIIVKAVTR
jgi:hypothetical protein